MRRQTCATTLTLRHMMRPFGTVPLLEQACHMSDIFTELEAKLARLEQFEKESIVDMAPS